MENKWFRRIAIILAIILALGVLLYAYLNVTQASPEKMPPLKNGDIVFQTSSSGQSKAILLASGSPYSHVGIVKELPDGEFVVIEAVGPVKETPLKNWIDRGIAGRITVKRLDDINDRQTRSITRHARAYYGRPYDPYFYFGGEAQYCSEFVYNAYKDAGFPIGKIQKIKDLNIDNPAVNTLLQARWQRHPLCRNGEVADFETCKGKVLEQTLITPKSIASDQKLQTIYSNY